MNDGEDSLTICFPSDFAYVPPVRKLIAGLIEKWGFPSTIAYRFETITDELCNNAIEYGSKKVDSVVRVECSVCQDRVDLLVEDSGGNEEDISKLEKAAKQKIHVIERLENRGRGLKIVQMLSDDLEVNIVEPGKTKIKVVKVL